MTLGGRLKRCDLPLTTCQLQVASGTELACKPQAQADVSQLVWQLETTHRQTCDSWHVCQPFKTVPNASKPRLCVWVLAWSIFEMQRILIAQLKCSTRSRFFFCFCLNLRELLLVLLSYLMPSTQTCLSALSPSPTRSMYVSLQFVFLCLPLFSYSNTSFCWSATHFKYYVVNRPHRPGRLLSAYVG